ncbi:response regulator [Paraglaciecola aquimarina]|uniref:histidine kinase n=1 Tax=Paraglaciecola algarum TaxID=3050085 RepID=A0ABS9D751_9ALTE|nr:response regulator [Paraglaciecola sp. G1-23]MCF2947649.1 response regulator [Paraglaciecola sp. G1-23]
MLHLNKLYKITSDNTLSFEQKISLLLTFGAEFFGLQLGIISQINDDCYTIKYAISPENALEAGTTFNVNSTYCIHTLKANEPKSFHHAGKSEIAQHPCYLDFGLESYIGAPLEVEGQKYGTLNFSSAEPKEKPFSLEEHEFIDLLSHWIGNEIARNKHISQLRKQKKRLIDQQNILNEIGKLAGVGAWEMDLVNQKLHWSESTRLIHDVDENYTPQLDTAINFYKPGDNRLRIQAIVEKAMLDGSDFSDVFEIITYTGKSKWVAAQGRAELEDGKCVRLYGAFQDITEQVFYREQLEKRHQELTSALEARSTFLANMSHEIRTPINGVIGSLQVMDKSGLNEKQQHFINLAQDSADSLLAQINDVLDFAKIDSNQVELENTPFAINELLNKCVQVYAIAAQKKSIQLISNFASTENITVIADQTRIRQIYTNLISNAIKFTLHGKIEIISSIKLTENNRAILKLDVSDSGIGMSEQQTQKLFLPFRQADISTTRKFGGTGLGLSISQSLAKLMGGKVTVQSQEGEGSIFSVELELEIQQGNIKQKIHAPTEISNKDLSQLKVLIVEDNDINQIVVSEMLNLRRISNDIAADGLEALAQIESEAKLGRYYDLILMDCQMPNMDGYQTTENIRKLNSLAANVPIIALTANSMKGDKEKCLASGMNDYLTKPLKQETLYSMIEKYA